MPAPQYRIMRIGEMFCTKSLHSADCASKMCEHGYFLKLLVRSSDQCNLTIEPFMHILVESAMTKIKNY